MIETWSAGAVDESMPEGILTDLMEQVWEHPWWTARANLMLALLSRSGVRPPARVLDAGCGWGVNLQALERRGYRADGLDISRRALERLDRPGRRLIEGDLTKAAPPHAGEYDAAVALDVIEHIDDDRGVLTQLGRLIRPGGVLLVSVPALPELFSEFDEVQGHRRRYLPETLRTAFVGTGLAVQQVLWWGEWMVPLVRRQRARPRAGSGQTPAEIYRCYLSLPPWPIPWALRLLFAIDHQRSLQGLSQTGTSLFAVARRAAAPLPHQPRIPPRAFQRPRDRARHLAD